ncbi:MAG: VWA domain-containing protein [Candidatus Thermoplasmatota archaeon]
MADAKLVLQVRSSKELERLSLLAEKIIDELKNKTFKKGDKLECEDIKLKVISTYPEAKLKVTPATNIEISVTPKSTDLILALDSSYSMRREDYKPSRTELAKKAALAIVANKIDVKDRVGIMSFGYNYAIHLPLMRVTNESLVQASASLKELKPAGRTSLSSAINGAIAMLEAEAREESMRILTIFTDGFDNIGEAPQQLALRAKDKNIIINTILLGEREEQEKTLKELAEITGGSHTYIANEEELLKVCSEFVGKKIEKFSSLEEFVELAKKEEKVVGEEGKFKKFFKQVKKKVW